MGRSHEESLAASEIRGVLSRVLAERGESRLEAILEASDPKAVVHAMEPIEAFYTFAQLEDDRKRVLIRLLSREQLDHLLDIDLWRGDRLDVERVLTWLELLWRAENELAVEWMLRTESELVVSILKLLCTVTEGPVAAEDSLTERQDQLPPFSAEGKLFVRFTSERAAELLKGPLILLAGTDIEYYLSLLQDVMVTVASETEESAYAKRWARIRDQGFVPPEEAYEIYRWSNQEDHAASSVDGKHDSVDETDGDSQGAPTALALVAPQGVLAAALEPLDEARLRELSRAVGVMGSRVMSADHLHFADLDAHRAALEKTLGYINIGLRDIAGADVGLARDALRRRSVANLFQRGYAKVAALGRRALVVRRQDWLSQMGLGVEVLDEPLGDVVRALARPRPLYPARALDGDGVDREFRDPEEVERCADLLGTVEALKRVFIDGLGLDLAPAQTFDLEGCLPADPGELTLGLILRTAMAQMLLNDRLQYAPVPTTALQTLSRTLGALEHEGVERHVVQSLSSRIEAPTDEDLRHIAAFVELHFANLITTFSGLEPTTSIDPRFVGAVVIRNV